MMRSIRASATIIISLSLYFNTYEARPIAGMKKNVELQRNKELESTSDAATEVVQVRLTRWLRTRLVYNQRCQYIFCETQ